VLRLASGRRWRAFTPVTATIWRSAPAAPIAYTLADELRLRHGVESLVIPADLARPEAPDEILAAIRANGRSVDALVNNAGYSLPGSYAATRWEDQAAFLQVLLTAVAALTHKVLPGMIERRFGRIVNVA
jgi:uncharacterized protein